MKVGLPQSTPARVGVFVLAAAVVFAGAAGIGNLTHSGSDSSAHDAHTAEPTMSMPGHDMTGHGMSGHDMSGHDMSGHGDNHAAGDEAALGLSSSANGFTLSPVTAPAIAGEPGKLSFQLIGKDNRPVTSFDVVHDKQLHLIVVRADTAYYRHAHPELAEDGTWSIDWTWQAGGTYRVFADFSSGGTAETLSRTVTVGGPAATVPLPAPSNTATVDGYTVTMSGGLSQSGDMLKYTITKDGKPVTDLQPYLGAYGHLGALRTKDLAYTHVHPLAGPAGPGIDFHAQAPGPGPYRLFLDFQHDGVVRTAEFTAVAS